MRHRETETPAVTLTLFGGFEARLATGASATPPTKKAQALLAYLAIRPGQRHGRDKLAALLWGERRDTQARGDLRQALVALRRALGDAAPSALLIEGQTLAVRDAGVEVDVATFEQRIAEGTPDALEHATELYRGDLLLGFALNEPLFEEWLVAERERLREVALEALARLLAHQANAGATERAIRTALRLLALDPLQEPVHRALMRLYARQGRRGSALKQYQVCVGALERELGTTPEAETKRLYQDLLRRPTEVDNTPETRGGPPARPVASARSPAPPDLPAAETPMFGREAELGLLREALDRAVQGAGRLAAIVGEAGIGKTRLVDALVTDALARGCWILIGRCHESDSILPFGPWVDACRSGDVNTDEEILGGLHPTRRAELARLLPEVGAAGLPAPTEGALPLFEGVAGLIEQVARRQPLLLVLEDLHWADDMSLRLAAFVSRRIPAWRALLVVTARDEELGDASIARRSVEELARAPHAVALSLAPLSRPDTASLVRALARVGSDAPTVTQIEENVWTVSEGNPFVAVEAMRAADRERVPSGSGPAGRLAVPDRVRDLVARRLDRLSERGQQMVAVAAVIGRRCDFALLRAASGMDEQDAAAAVEETVRLRMLQAVGDQLDFVHDRVRDVAHGRLLSPRRGLLHRAVLEALETRPRRGRDALTREDDPGEQVEQLAHHALRGEVWDRAWRYGAHAAIRAAQRGANREAVAFFEQAHAALERLPETAETRGHAVDLLVGLRNSLQALGEFSRGFDCLRRAETIAEALGDRPRLLEIAGTFTGHFWTAGDQDSALAAARRALAIATDLGDANLVMLGRHLVGRILGVRGEYRAAIDMLGPRPDDSTAAPPPAEVPAARSARAKPPWMLQVDRCFSYANLATCLAEVGDFDTAVAAVRRAGEIAEAIDRHYSRVVARVGLGSVWLRRGWLDEAVPMLDSALALCEQMQILVLFPWVAAPAGYAAALAGRVADGRRLLALAVERAGAMRMLVYQSQRIAWLSEVSLLAGDADEALRLGERAIELARAHGERGNEAWALRLAGVIQASRGGAGGRDARDFFEQALAMAGELGLAPLAAHCHLALAALPRDGGDEAARHADTAAALLRDMAMRVPEPPAGSAPRDRA